ncbi:MAG: membrane protein insertion efficiency factor YidD [Rhodospirillaceae bacterium]|nr:membrane protein insertion efficiency factor YidD [Rhodospirillaceae bacterium]MCA8934016.1 membrane protein insertion efficiency factor YidD [Rhodospirillaceae bacterium]
MTTTGTGDQPHTAAPASPSLAARLLIGLVLAYRYTLSPLIGGNCRFVPTCSEYGLEAIRRHGALRGGWLTLRRLGRCRPGCAAGYDPVPAPQSHDLHADLCQGPHHAR